MGGTGAPRPAPAEGARGAAGRPVSGRRLFCPPVAAAPALPGWGGPRGRGRALGSRARRSALNPARCPAGMAAAGAR